MPVLSVRNLLPVVTAVVATLFLATAVPHDLVPRSPTATLRAEVQRCVMDGRDADECRDEAEGKSLVERADWMARDDTARRASR